MTEKTTPTQAPLAMTEKLPQIKKRILGVKHKFCHCEKIRKDFRGNPQFLH